MIHLDTLRVLLGYSDSANQRILHAVSELNDSQLDHPFDMGVGSLRKTLLHLWAGEDVWLHRWQGKAETPWPAEDEPVGPGIIAARFSKTWLDRDAFLATLANPDLGHSVAYRDSKGSRFMASLGDMMMQMCVHSIHHRAQAVNMIRRLGGPAPELDYMMSLRRPA